MGKKEKVVIKKLQVGLKTTKIANKYVCYSYIVLVYYAISNLARLVEYNVHVLETLHHCLIFSNCFARGIYQ